MFGNTKQPKNDLFVNLCVCARMCVCVCVCVYLIDPEEPPSPFVAGWYSR